MCHTNDEHLVQLETEIQYILLWIGQFSSLPAVFIVTIFFYWLSKKGNMMICLPCHGLIELDFYLKKNHR